MSPSSLPPPPFTAPVAPPPPNHPVGTVTTEAAESESTRGAARPLLIVATALVLIALAGALIVRAKTVGESLGPETWTRDPELVFTLTTSFHPEYGWRRGPQFVGSADDLYVLEPGSRSGRVSRYVNGQEQWSTTVRRGIPGFLKLEEDGDGLYVLTADRLRSNLLTLVKLDRDDGSKEWSIELGDDTQPYLTSDRLFMSTAGVERAEAMLEFDANTGQEVNRLEADQIVWQRDRVVSIDRDRAVAQRYDLDFRPMGQPINLESGWFGSDHWGMPSTSDDLLEPDDWVYSLDNIVYVKAADGELLARCTTSLDYLSPIQLASDGAIVSADSHRTAGFKLGDGTCEELWERGENERAEVAQNYALFDTFVGLTDVIETEIVELSTGRTVRTERGNVYVNQGDLLLVHRDGVVTVSTIADGVKRWSVPAADEAEIELTDDALLVVIPDDDFERASVEVYGD